MTTTASVTVDLSAGLRYFFERELDNYRQAVDNGDLDPADGAPTLGWAIDSLIQAPEDIAAYWLTNGDSDDFDDVGVVQSMWSETLALANLVAIHGSDTPLRNLL